jgi:small subunit ribosomal protein S1
LTLNTSLSTRDALLKAENDLEDLDFGEMLEVYDYDQPRRSDILKGTIMVIDDTEILVDVGLKRDAFVPRADLDRLPEELIESLKPGQEIHVFVLRPQNRDGQLIVSINKALQQEDWLRAEEIMNNGEVIEATVVGKNRGGLLVNFGRLTGFVPQSHVVAIPRGMHSEQLSDAKADLINDTLTLTVIEVNRRRNRLILSEREARQAARQQRMQELEKGSVVTGHVVSLVDFGAFVDIGGVDGLIHISNLDRNYVSHPSEILSVGDEVEVRIDEIDVERERISLNRAVLQPDPWDEIDEHYSIGDLVAGTVSNIADFGVFVEIPHSLEGLVHISEMSTYGVTNPADLVSPGDEILVRILDIDRTQQRISLSVDAVTVAEQEKWMHERMKDLPDASAEVDMAESPALSAGIEETEEAEVEGEPKDETQAPSEDTDTGETDGQTSDDVLEEAL